MAKKVNPRQKKLDAISAKIAMFIVTETYTDESALQHRLAGAIQILEEVGKQLAANDEKAETQN